MLRSWYSLYENSWFWYPLKGPGIWKFNNNLLTDSGFVSELKENIPQWILEAETDLPNKIGGQWGFLKFKIGEFSRSYGAKLKKSKILLKSNLEKELEKLSLELNEENKVRYRSLQQQLDSIIETEIQGVILSKPQPQPQHNSRKPKLQLGLI